MLSSSNSLEHERYYGLGMDAVVIALTRTRTVLWFGQGCSRHCTSLENECYYGLDMDALVIALTRMRTVLWLGVV